MIYDKGEFMWGCILFLFSLSLIVTFVHVNRCLKKSNYKRTPIDCEGDVSAYIFSIMLFVLSLILFYDSCTIDDLIKEKYNYTDITIQKIRIDDDSEYHLTYIKNGWVESENDIKDWDMCIQYGNYDKAIGKIKTSYTNENIVYCYYIYLPNNYKIEYFDD